MNVLHTQFGNFSGCDGVSEQQWESGWERRWRVRDRREAELREVSNDCKTEVCNLIVSLKSAAG